MNCLQSVLDRLMSMGISSSTEFLVETVNFYCNGGVPPDEIVSEIYAVSSLSGVIKILRQQGVQVDSSVIKVVLKYLREGENMEKIISHFQRPTTPKPRF